MTPIELLRAELKSANEAHAQFVAHTQDKRTPRPEFDEWWGPAAIQSAAQEALDYLPALLAVVEAAQRLVRASNYPSDDFAPAALALEQALAPFTKPKE